MPLKRDCSLRGLSLLQQQQITQKKKEACWRRFEREPTGDTAERAIVRTALRNRSRRKVVERHESLLSPTMKIHTKRKFSTHTRYIRRRFYLGPVTKPSKNHNFFPPRETCTEFAKNRSRTGTGNKNPNKYWAEYCADHSNWSSPLVVIAKSDGRIRMACNYKRVNAQSVILVLPLPTVDDLLA